MFIKLTHSKGHSYAQLVESFRDANGQPRQRNLVTLGRVDEYDGYSGPQIPDSHLSDKYGDRPARAQAVSVDKAPAPNRLRSVGTAPTGCVPRPQTPTGLVLGKEQYLFKFKTQNGAAPSSCVVTEQT